MASKRIKGEHPKITESKRNHELEAKAKTPHDILETELTPQEEKEAVIILKKPDLLQIINNELSLDHLLDDKEKIFTFCSCVSSRLKPKYRFSSALTGDSSEGKTNLKNAIFKHLPEAWYIDLTRITASSLEDDIHPYNLIYFGEKSANKNLIESVKQLVEDGMDILKKDARTDFKESRREIQKRKVGIFSTTDQSNDKELASRYALVSVHGNKTKYKIVNNLTLTTASNIELEIQKIERENNKSWLKKALMILQDFDIVTIPYGYLFKVESTKARSQRDLKRFLNCIRTLAWLHQYNRIQFNYKNYRILVAAPQDFLNAMIISADIFNQNISDLEPRLQEVIDAYKKLCLRENPQDVLFDLPESEHENLKWIDRSVIQKEMGINSADTIKKRLKKLSDLNIFIQQHNKAKNRCYVAFKNLNNDRPANSHTRSLLITHEPLQIYDYIKHHYPLILHTTLGGAYDVNYKEVNINTAIFSPNDRVPTNFLQKNALDNIKDDFLEKIEKVSGSIKCVPKNEKIDLSNQNLDYKKFISYVSKLKTDYMSCFDFDDIEDFIKETLEKQDPNLWLDHQVKNKMLEEPILGKFRILTIGGIS